MDRRQFKMRSLAFAIQQSLRRPLLRASLGLGGLVPMAALANPGGGQVVGGTATINAPDANHTVIDQQSQQAIINWQQFSVGSNQYVQFNQPNSSAVVLNRVVGGDPTNILGSLKANGQVFLVNPNGVFFGAGASLDVQGLVATTQDISNSDFMAGHYVFAKGANAADGGVTNAGNITAKAGGYVVLAGDYAANAGVITAQAGHVVLASGTKTTLTLAGNSLIGFAVNQATLSNLAGVSNAGRITADGGQVLMTADVANQLKATVVNNTGLVEAHSITSHNGSVVLSATGGNIENSGTLDASATQPSVSGGSIVVKGNATTGLTSTSKIIATGDNAKGGFIEISGHSIKVRGLTRAGRGGTILIDPTKLILQSGGSPFHSTGAGGNTSGIGTGYIASHLSTGTNMSLTATSTISHSVLAASIHSVGAGPLYGNLKLKAGTGGIKLKGLKIHIKGNLTVSDSQGTASMDQIIAGAVSLRGLKVNDLSPISATGNVTVNAGGNINIGRVTAATASISAGTHSVTLANGTTTPSVKTTGGALTITAGQIKTSAGDLWLSAAAATLNVQGAIGSTASFFPGKVKLDGKGVNVSKNILANSSININAGTGAASVQRVSASKGNVTVKGTGVAANGSLSAGTAGAGGSISVNAGAGAASLKKVNARTNLAITAAGVTDSSLISANAVTVSPGTGNNISLTLKTGSFTLNSGANVNLNDTAETGAATLAFGGGTFGNVSASFGGAATLTSGLSANSLTLSAAGALNLGSTAITLSSGATLTGARVNGTGLLSANAVTVSAGTGDVSLVTKTGSVTLNSGAKVTLDDTAETGAATLAFGGGTFGDITGHFGGNVSLASGVTGLNLNVDTPGNVVGGKYLYNLDTAWIDAGGKIDFSNAQLTLGSGVNPNATGDTVVTDLLASHSLAPSSLVPNSVLTAGAGQPIALGVLDFTGSYLRLNADAFAFNGAVTVPATSVVQMAPVSTVSDISVEQTLSSTAPVNFGAASQLTLFPTVVIGGGSESGNVAIGQNGPLSLNDTNLFIVTTGSVSGLTSVRTTGIVSDLAPVISGGPVFQPPTAQEVRGTTETSVNAPGSESPKNNQTKGQQASHHVYASPFSAPCLTVVASGNQGYTCVASATGPAVPD